MTAQKSNEENVAAGLKGLHTFTTSFGNEFTLNKASIIDWLDLMDNTRSGARDGKTRTADRYQGMMDLSILKPAQMKVPDFENEPYGGFKELDEVAEEIVRFQQGNRKSTNA